MDKIKSMQPDGRIYADSSSIGRTGIGRGLVSATCANLYRRATFHSEIDSQVVLGERVAILDKTNDFYHIRSEDGYTGWINRHQVVETNNDNEQPFTMVTAILSELYEQPDPSSPAKGLVVAGNYLLMVEKHKEWVQVGLPDGDMAWVSASALEAMPRLSRNELIAYARRMMGTPYIWGGKTPLGLDCSGFTQLVHKVFNISLRRDARMQYEDARPVSYDPLQGEPGDLMFFAEQGQRITHVGFCLGEGRILHARGKVHINSLCKGEADFDPVLLNDFVAVRTFMKEEK